MKNQNALLTGYIYRSRVLDYVTLQHQAGHPTGDVGIAHIYFGLKDQRDQTPEKVVGSILRQLGYCKSQLPTEIKTLYENWTNEGKTPDLQKLIDTLISVVRGFSRVWIFFDGLDQCDKRKQRVDLLLIIRRLMVKTNISGFATSRSYAGDVRSVFNGTKKIEVFTSREDIECFVRWKIGSLCREKLTGKIVSEISRSADGMYVRSFPHRSAVFGYMLLTQLALGFDSLNLRSSIYSNKPAEERCYRL